MTLNKSKLLILMVSILAAISFASCDLSNNVDDDKYKKYISAATLTKYNSELVFITDDSLKLYPTNKLTAADSLMNKRYLITFQIKTQANEEATIDLLSAPQMMITDTVRTDLRALDGIANDLVQPYLIWMSGTYVNMLIDIKASGYTKHDYYLFEKEMGNDTVKLEFRHDAHNDSRDMVFQPALTYNLGKYINNSDADTIIFKIKMNMPQGNYEEVEIKHGLKDNTEQFLSL